jgi:hypothetical protein
MKMKKKKKKRIKFKVTYYDMESRIPCYEVYAKFNASVVEVVEDNVYSSIITMVREDMIEDLNKIAGIQITLI